MSEVECFASDVSKRELVIAVYPGEVGRQTHRQPGRYDQRLAGYAAGRQRDCHGGHWHLSPPARQLGL